MKKLYFTLLTVLACTATISIFQAKADHHKDHDEPKATVGSPAPDFTLYDSNGDQHSLSDFQGKTVVLEWINYDCPFVKKHYSEGNMQSLQKKYTDQDVVWLSINSSAEGLQGNFSADEINKRISNTKSMMTAYLVDESGDVGRLYGAKTTPNMYIITPDGKLAYAGAIDDKPTADASDIQSSRNYVSENLDLILSGGKCGVETTKPYGCSVKYASK
ncbi:MAG: thioredoxin family protein [Candidatus Kapaibacteriales bacterium]